MGQFTTSTGGFRHLPNFVEFRITLRRCYRKIVREESIISIAIGTLNKKIWNVVPVNRKKPRISVNELAKFMVSSDSIRVSIVRNAKEPKEFRLLPYKHARDAIKTYLCDESRDLRSLVNAERRLEQTRGDSSIGRPVRNDAKLSIKCLQDIRTIDGLDKLKFTLPASQSTYKLSVNQVEISVHIDLIVTKKGSDRVGGAVLRLNKFDQSSEVSIRDRAQIGKNAASIIHLCLTKNPLPTDRILSDTHCMSIDVQGQAIYTAPKSYVRITKNIENACLGFSALWDRI